MQQGPQPTAIKPNKERTQKPLPLIGQWQEPPETSHYVEIVSPIHTNQTKGNRN